MTACRLSFPVYLLMVTVEIFIYRFLNPIKVNLRECLEPLSDRTGWCRLAKGAKGVTKC